MYICTFLYSFMKAFPCLVIFHSVSSIFSSSLFSNTYVVRIFLSITATGSISLERVSDVFRFMLNPQIFYSLFLQKLSHLGSQHFLFKLQLSLTISIPYNNVSKISANGWFLLAFFAILCIIYILYGKVLHIRQSFPLHK